MMIIIKIIIIIIIIIKGTRVGQVGASAYHREMDAPADQSLGWHPRQGYGSREDTVNGHGPYSTRKHHVGVWRDIGDLNGG